jgi:hypothetical protein
VNALQVDERTGFLSASGNITAPSYFTPEKKLKLIEVSKQIHEETGEWPDFSKICGQLGIHPRTLERHLQQDKAFAEEFRDLILNGKWKLESMMYKMSSKNPMYCFGWLRKWFPEEYNPDYRHSVTVDINIVHGDQSRLSGIVDAEVVSPTVISTPNSVVHKSI